MDSGDPTGRRRPEVTVSDPAHPTATGDVLGDDRPPRSRRTRVLAGLVVLAVAGWAVGAEVRDRRAEAHSSLTPPAPAAAPGGRARRRWC